MSMTGRCLCGAVSFTAEDVETDVQSCHCSQCRRWSGASAIAAIAGRVEFSGAEHLHRYDSSAWAERGFCRECGASLFYRLKEADRYYMSVGAFDDQSPFRLASEIYIDDKPPGYDFAGDHPRMTGAEFMASLGEGMDERDE